MISKQIQIAAKLGDDPKMNPALDLVLQKARYNSVPRDIVERAILKGSGKLGSDNLYELFYEGYGPGGSAVLVKAMTSNTNRTASKVKTIFNKFGGSLGEQGSVIWQFEEKGVFVINGKIQNICLKGKNIENVVPLSEQDRLDVFDLPIEDVVFDDGNMFLYINKSDYSLVLDLLGQYNYNIIEFDFQFIAQNKISLSIEDEKRLEELVSELKKDDDVDMVWVNVE